MENQSVSQGQRLIIFLFFFIIFFLYPCCSTFVKMKDLLWIEDIVENTSTPSFFINSKVGMFDFVNPHKVVVKRNAFLACSSA